MFKKLSCLLSILSILICAPAWANSSSPTPSPSPSASNSAFSFCAPFSTGIPQKVKAPKCPRSMRALGQGPIIHGTKRPGALDPTMRNRFLAAQTAGLALGHKISVRSGWRSWSTQDRLYQNALIKYGSARIASRWVLPPEKSMHVWGLALDIQFASPEAKTWFRWHSNRFGLCRTYENEWWHFEPVVAPGKKCPALKPFAK